MADKVFNQFQQQQQQQQQPHLGRFSMTEPSWMPTSASASSPPWTNDSSPIQPNMTTNASSDLNASGVKEFVPGQGWAVNIARSGSTAVVSAANDNIVDARQFSNGSTSTISGSESYTPYAVLNDGFSVASAAAAATPTTPASAEASALSSSSSQHLPTTETAGPLPATISNAFPDSTMDPPMPLFRAIQALGLPDRTWRTIRDQSRRMSHQMDPQDTRHKAIPLPYCNGDCLDDARTTGSRPHHLNNRSSSFGYVSSTFAVTSREDGYRYCLHRFDNVRGVSPKIAHTVTEMWTTIHKNTSSTLLTGVSSTIQNHPGIVTFVRCFVASRALFFVHHYIPGAQSLRQFLVTLRQQHHQHQQYQQYHHQQQQQQHQEQLLPISLPLPESQIWSCLSQLVSAIRTVHGCQLAVRSIQTNHILVNLSTSIPADVEESIHELNQQMPPKCTRIRLRLNCVGIVDALEFESRKNMTDLQQQDIRDLGYLVLSLTTGIEITSQLVATEHNNHQQQHYPLHNTTTTNNNNNNANKNSSITKSTTLARCEDYLRRHYSRDLHNLVMTLIQPGTPYATPPTIFDLSSVVMHRTYFDEQDTLYRSCDRTTNALAAEYESGRALRLLLKLGFVNERPEYGHNRRWSQSGDCYIISLFRDYGRFQCLCMCASAIVSCATIKRRVLELQ
jgi:PAB-dependent poly(A)-specific ribonuclease subunit 3